MKYLEYAVGDPKHRNQILEVKALFRLIKSKGAAVPLYRSVYFYDEDVVEYVNKRKSIKSFPGKRYIAWIPIDIDKGSNSDEYTLIKMRKILDKLDNYGVNQEALQIYFSGTGYHIMITNEEFGFVPSEDLPIRVEATLSGLGLLEDKSVTRKTAIIRASHTLNFKSRLYKIPLTYDEATNLTWEQIHDLAKTQRLDFLYQQYGGQSTFVDKVVEVDKQMPEKTKIYNYDSTAHLLNYVCMQRLMAEGPVEGTRNNTVLRLASHFKWVGLPEDYAISACLHWNEKGEAALDEQNVINRVTYVYNSAVKYGCNDEVLKFYCRPSCKDYKNRNMEGDINPLSIDILNKEYRERVAMMKNTKNFINLKNILGLEHDCILFPGELVTFQGDTGVNKTSLLQNILLGYDMRNNVFNHHKQNILLYETELGGGGIQERFLSILSGLPRTDLYKYPDIEKKYSKNLANISVQTGPINLEGIESIISKYQYDVIVIDYIEKILHPLFEKGNDTPAISNIMRKLSTMAQTYQVVIIAVSQVARHAVSNGGQVGLHSGKGSSAIEHSSRRVFSINGAQKSNYRTISLDKANNDVTFSNVLIERQPNWRFVRR